MLQKRSLIFLMVPAVVYIAGVLVYPAFTTVYTSFFKYNFANPWTRAYIGIENYVDLFRDDLFLKALQNTAVIVLIAISLEFLIGLAVALVFNADLRGRNVFMGLFLIPTVMAPVVIGLVWRFMYNDQFGVLTYLLREISFLPEEGVLLAHPKRAIYAVIATDVWEWTPFMTVILLSGLAALPPVYYEAARIDGANRWSLFQNVTVPLLRPVIVIAVLLRLAEVIKLFDIVFMLTKGGPGHSTETLNLYAYRVSFRYFNMGYGSCLAVFLLITISVIFFVLVRLMLPKGG